MSILVSVIGLTCALALVSSSLLFITTTESNVSSNLDSNSINNDSYDISIDYSIDYPYLNTNSLTNIINHISDNLTTNLHLKIFSKLKMFYSATNFYTTQKINPLDATQTESNNSVIIVELNSDLKSDLQTFLTNNSSLPQKNSQIQQAFALQTGMFLATTPNITYFRNKRIVGLQKAPIDYFFRFV